MPALVYEGRVITELAAIIRETAGDERYSQQRSIRIDKNFEEMKRILGIGGRQGEEISEMSAIEALKKRVRSIFNVEDLTRMREYLVENAHKIMRGT